MTTTFKRPWHMFYPLAGLILICLAWSIYWYLAFAKAQEITAAQRRGLTDQGIKLSCSHEAWGGFPFRFEFRCEGVTIDYANTTAKTAKVLAVAQAYNPFHILFLVNGPTALSKGGLAIVTVTHDDALISLTLNRKGDWDVSSDVAHVTVPERFSTASLKLFARKNNGKTEFAGNADGLDIPGQDNAHAPIDHAEFLAQSSDGTSLDITALTILSAGINFAGTGNVTLDASHFLRGNLSAHTNDIDGLLRLISPLAKMNDKDRAAIKDLLTTQGKNSKSPARKADFIAMDGSIFWGPFKLADLGPFY